MENTKFYRVGIYLRLSNEDKEKKEGNSESIKNQRNLLYDYIQKQENFILIQEYCDEDLSGAGTYRPEFERLIKDCEAKKLDIVLCKSQSRFSRDMEIIEKYLHNKFREWNIRFIGISDHADTEILGNKKARQINGLVNEWYLEDVSNNIRSAFLAKMKHGEFISPFASYGYKVEKGNNNHLIIDPIASVIVKKIFNLYLSGFSFTKIADELNQKNIPSPSLYKYQNHCKLNIISHQSRNKIKWSANAIKTILTNEVYIGNLIQGKRTTVSYKNHKIIQKEKKDWIKVEHTHEAIIDSKIFEKVQNKIKEKHRPTKKLGIIHLFSKKVYCQECHCYFRKKSTKYYQYLVCSNQDCSNKKAVRYDELEHVILKKINERIWKYYDKDIFLKEMGKRKDTLIHQNLEILKVQENEVFKRKQKNEFYLKNTYQDKVDKVISLSQFKEFNAFYLKEIKRCNQELGGIKEKRKDLETKKIKDYSYSEFTFLNRKILEEFVERIEVGMFCLKTKTREIVVTWNNQ